MIVFLSSCKEEILKADAYGNFETNTIIVSSQAKGQLLYLNVEEGQKIALNEWVGLVDTLMTGATSRPYGVPRPVVKT